MEKVYYFLDSYIGMYITQVIFHSAVAAVLADCTIVAWGVTAPTRRQAMRIGVILIPLLAYPLYQFLNPERGGIHFRIEALMDSSGWLLMELWGKVPVIIFFFLVLGLSAMIFLFQEFLPIILHTAKTAAGRSRDEEGGPDSDDGGGDDLPRRYEESVMRALEKMPGDKPEAVVIDDEDLVVFSSTGLVPAVYVSTGLIDTLDESQLLGALAHEVAHIRRTRKPVLTFLFVFRVLMFFNPVALFEFRRAVQDEEEICDDEAVRATGDPGALSAALENFLEDGDQPEAAGEADIKGHIENYSHDMLIRKRIERLHRTVPGSVDRSGRLSVLVFALGTLIVNYFIV